MRAIFFNSGGVRLGESTLPHDCALADFGGAYFVKTGTEAALDGGGLGWVFEESPAYVLGGLDVFNPRRVMHPRIDKGHTAK